MAQSRSDSFGSTVAVGSDSFISTLEGGSDSFRSTLVGGHDFMLDNCCDLCERDGLQEEVVGFCVDCQDYLCTECFRNHLKPKPCREHVLLDQHQMPSREAMKPHAHHVMDIKVRSRDDSKACGISGCVVLLGDKLVVVDYYNDKVKLIDLTHNKIVSQLKLTGTWLWHITQVDSTKVAVTSRNTQAIYVINAGDKKLKLDREVKVKVECIGIASINDNLVVSYDKPLEVEIISRTGQVLQTVLTEDKRYPFNTPRHVAVSKDKQTIFISDWVRDTVTRVDLTGNVQATYKDAKLQGPSGLTVDHAGRVCVCGVASNNILRLSADLTEVQELIQLSDDVVGPSSICYCEVTDRLYVGMDDNDVVKVYQL